MKKSTYLSMTIALLATVAVGTLSMPTVGDGNSNRHSPADGATPAVDTLSAVTSITFERDANDVAQDYGDRLSGRVDVAATDFGAYRAADNAIVAQHSAETLDDDNDANTESRVAAARAKMSGPVAALARAGGPQPVDLVVSYADHPALFDEARVAELGGEVVRRFEVFDMQTVRLPASALDTLAYEDNVDRLSLDDVIRVSSVASRAAANLPGPTSGNSAYSGDGVGIAILDTGISAHADLSSDITQYSFLNGAYPVPLVANGEIVSLNDDPRIDQFGHGTHVAGIISGSGSISSDAFRGSAKQSRILSLQVLDGDGNGSMSDIMAALDWLLQYGQYFDVRVINLSLGKGVTESNTTDPLVHAVEALWDQGIVVVVAAGNLGHAGAMTVKSPGNSRKVITVGSLTDAGTSAADDDYVSTFFFARTVRCRPGHETRPACAGQPPHLSYSQGSEAACRSSGSNRQLLNEFLRRSIPGDVRHQHVDTHGGGSRRADAAERSGAEPGHGEGTADAFGTQD